jgi:hypothetical protein
LREKIWLRLFENRELRKIFESKREEIAGDCGKFHNDELHDLYFSPDIIGGKKYLQGSDGEI